MCIRDRDRVSSSSCVEDEVSSNGPFIFCDGLGSAKTYSKFVAPFAWYEIGQWGGDRCYDDERCFETELCADRVMELFQ